MHAQLQKFKTIQGNNAVTISVSKSDIKTEVREQILKLNFDCKRERGAESGEINNSELLADVVAQLREHLEKKLAEILQKCD